MDAFDFGHRRRARLADIGVMLATTWTVGLAPRAQAEPVVDPTVRAPDPCIVASAGAHEKSACTCPDAAESVRLGLYEAFAINDAGTVVGDVEIADDWTRHAAVMKVNEELIDLGAGKNRHAQALAINEAGVVVGRTLVDDRDPGPPFRWSPARGFEVLPLPKGASAGDAVGIDDRGTIVINAYARNPRRPRAFELLGAYLFSPLLQKFTLLSGLDDSVSEAKAMSGNGLVVGSSYDASGELRPVLWDQTRKARALPYTQRAPETLEQGEIRGIAYATAVNRRGAVVGQVAFDARDTRAVAWLPPHYEEVDLGVGTADAINDADLAGGSVPGSDGLHRAQVWDLTTGAAFTLPAPNDGRSGDFRVLDLNNLGVAVGYDAQASGNERSVRYAALRCK